MPGLDGTGPVGYGPMTGGARGHCGPFGMGTGRRVFGGRRWGFAATPAGDVEALRNESRVLKKRLEEIDARVKDLTSRQESGT